MATMYCALCKRPVEARRHVGVGSVVLAILTGGLSLLAIPFYRKRCSICQSTTVLPLSSRDRALLAGESDPRRLAELERRLLQTEEELDATARELDRVRDERNFYQDLRGDPDPGKNEPPGRK